MSNVLTEPKEALKFNQKTQKRNKAKINRSHYKEGGKDKENQPLKKVKAAKDHHQRAKNV